MKNSLLTEQEFNTKYPGMDYLVYLNTNGKLIIRQSEFNCTNYIGCTDPYTENGVEQPARHIEKIPFPEMVDELMKYYPKTEKWNLQKLYDRFGDKLSPDEKSKLENLL